MNHDAGDTASDAASVAASDAASVAASDAASVAASDAASVADRLADLSDTLADLAIDRLRRASDAVRAGEEPDPGLVAEEKRITRARRAVDKAVHLLRPPAAITVSGEDP